jgi:antitoxin (DNA-binding transcriptional repressor) of toxin-antitoxin stability system
MRHARHFNDPDENANDEYRWLDDDESSQYCDFMKTATVRDLRYDFPKIEAWLAGGEEILITKHSKPVARISGPGVVSTQKLPHPDYRARLKRIWGGRVFTQEEVDEMRAFETGEP